ncbi:MAG: glycosyltransferase [Ferruginibacter sp.]
MAAVILISCLFAALYAGLLLYYRYVWTSVPEYKQNRRRGLEPPTGFDTNRRRGLEPPTGFTTFISVIIPARNEQLNIADCLNSLQEQSYPKELFEIIVVDDHSEDETAAIVKKYAAFNVRMISLRDHVTDRINSYKKKAIEVAIAEAKGTLIVTTDADCYLPENWLSTLAAFYEEKNPAFIAAPVAIDCNNRFIEIFQSLDFMTLQGITGAVVSKKQMSMCNGANMAYERTAFYEVNGFAGIDNIASGDDMLLMYKIFERYPERVMFLKSPDAIVQTQPVDNIKQFFNQRIRWASKSGKYKDKRILPVLLLVYIFNCLLLALPVIAIFDNAGLGTMFQPPSGLRAADGVSTYGVSSIDAWLILLLVKTGAELLFLYPVATFFRKRSLLWLFPLMQPFHILYTVIAGWLGAFGKYTWKDRRVS